MDILILAAVGLLSGVCASMGLGGGFVLLVYLTLCTQLSQLESQFTNLLFFLPVAAISILLHLKNRLIETRILLRSILIGILGVLLGGWMSGWMEEELLTKLFGGFVLIIGLKELFHKKAAGQPAEEQPPPSK